MRAWALVGLVTTLVLLGTGVSAAGVTTCHIAADPNIFVSSARNMSCRAAVHDIRRYRHSISRRFTTPVGFHCQRVSGAALEGQWRCVRGVRAYRIEFAD